MATPAQASEFDVARTRAQQEANAAAQGQKEALKRRFASMGNLNSGAALKQERIVDDETQKNLGGRLDAIGAAERAEAQRRQDIKDSQMFQSSEAEKSRLFGREERLGTQDFSAGQAELGRKFQTGERLGSQDFAALQAEATRKWQTGERLSGQEFNTLSRKDQNAYLALEAEKGRISQANLQDKNLQANKQMFSDEMAYKKEKDAADAAFRDKEFDRDTNTLEFNKQMAQGAANDKGPLGNMISNVTRMASGDISGEDLIKLGLGINPTTEPIIDGALDAVGLGDLF